MKSLIFEYEKLKPVGELLNQLCMIGVTYGQAKIAAQIGDILDSGKPVEVEEKGDGGDGDMDEQEIQ